MKKLIIFVAGITLLSCSDFSFFEKEIIPDNITIKNKGFSYHGGIPQIELSKEDILFVNEELTRMERVYFVPTRLHKILIEIYFNHDISTAPFSGIFLTKNESDRLIFTIKNKDYRNDKLATFILNKVGVDYE